MQTQDILLSSNLSIQIRNTILFKHGQDGFHLWEAGIVLTRYVYYNLMPSKQTFMDLGTGVGITGILISKYTRVIMTDYNQDVLDNAWENVKINQSPCILMQLDWRNHHKITFQVDVIVGSDLVYAGAPLQDLYKTIVKLLKQNGKFYLIIPSNRMCKDEFIKIMLSEQLFEMEQQLLQDEKYYTPCLLDSVQSDLLYPGLKELKFYMYVFVKK